VILRGLTGFFSAQLFPVNLNFPPKFKIIKGLVTIHTYNPPLAKPNYTCGAAVTRCSPGSYIVEEGTRP
jgi:hypothetical protein